MPTTPNHNLYYPEGSSAISPLHPVLAGMQTSVETALDTLDNYNAANPQMYRAFDNNTARDAFWPTPQRGYAAAVGTGETQELQIYNGTAWQNPPIAWNGQVIIQGDGTIAPAHLPESTETTIGAVERATLDEARTATDTTRYVSPAGLAYAIQTTGNSADTHGVCTRFPDGTQICYNRRFITPTANSVSSFTWTFPFVFSEAPAVTVTANTTSSAVTNTCVDGSPSTTSCKPGILRTSTASTELLSMPIGRWK